MTLGNMLPTAACPLWVISGSKTLHFDVRFTLQSGHVRRNGLCQLWPNSGHGALFDHLVRDGHYPWWHLDAEHSRRLKVDDETRIWSIAAPAGRRAWPP